MQTRTELAQLRHLVSGLCLGPWIVGTYQRRPTLGPARVGPLGLVSIC